MFRIEINTPHMTAHMRSPHLIYMYERVAPVVQVSSHAVDRLYDRCVAFATEDPRVLERHRDYWADWLARRALIGNVHRMKRHVNLDDVRATYDILPAGDLPLMLIRLELDLKANTILIPTVLSYGKHHASRQARTYVRSTHLRLEAERKRQEFTPARKVGFVVLPEST